MTSRRQRAAAALLALLLGALTACATDEEPGTVASRSVGTSSAAPPGAGATPSDRAGGSPSAATGGSCRVVVGEEVRREPRVLYALRFTLAPGARSRGDRDATLYTYPPLSQGVRVLSTTPGGLDQVLERAVLDATVDRGTTLLDGIRGLRWSVTNTTGRTARYLAWAGATAFTLLWTRTCEGRSASGSVTLVGPISRGLVRCGERAAPAPTDGRRLLRAAQRLVCQQDSTEAAPFRSLQGRVPEGPN